MSMFGLHSDQPASAGATRSPTWPPWSTPADSIEEMLSLSHPAPANWKPYEAVWAYARKFVLALAAELTLDSTPASPVLSTTTAPAATACSLNWRVRSAVLSGIGYSPNDSLRMSAWSTVSAQSRPSRIVELKAALALPNTFIPISDAPGAIPR